MPPAGFPAGRRGRRDKGTDAMTVKRALRRTAAGGLAAAVLAFAGCGNVGNPIKALTGDIPPPDEFQVMAHKPLQMPTSAELPEPQPGAPSPLDPDPHRDARVALLGASGAQAIPAASATPSAGEQVLLSSANAAAASGDIRVQLESDKVTAEANKPYEPPSLGELLSGSGKEKVDDSEAIDPVAESQRLQREGQQAPSDPQAVADIPASERPPRVEPAYPSGRPQAPIQHSGTTTAF
jgi:hypothetical protein